MSERTDTGAAERLVEAWLRAAATTANRLPADRLQGFRSSWPEFMRSDWQGYGWHDARVRAPKPTAADISHFDRMLSAMLACLAPAKAEALDLPPDTGRVLWLRAAGWSWGKIGRVRAAIYGKDPRHGGRSRIPGGNTAPSLRVTHERGIKVLMAELGR